jgi:hypothetical protein
MRSRNLSDVTFPNVAAYWARDKAGLVVRCAEAPSNCFGGESSAVADDFAASVLALHARKKVAVGAAIKTLLLPPTPSLLEFVTTRPYN